MRRAITVLAVVVLLAGPTALAFFSGGYFDSARLIAGAVAWVLYGVAAVVSPAPLPRGRAGRIALAGLVLLTAWTGASIAWSVLASPATDALQRLLLYVAALASAAALLREPSFRRATEPALALGVFVVVGYGLLERLLPGVFEYTRYRGAFGRFDQPLTYWNAMGALAGIGAVLAVRLAGDADRSRLVRGAAAAAVPLLATGLWLSYSRGALAAVGIGLLALAALSRRREQLRAIGVGLVTGGIAAFVADRFDGVRALLGSDGTREREGLIMLVVLVVLGVAGALAARFDGRFRQGGIALPRRAAVALGLAVIVAAAAVVGLAARDSGHATAPSASAERLRSLESNRYEYWGVAFAHGFAAEPVRGVGAGGFGVIWLKNRDVGEPAKQAHSLYIETLAELGIVGFLLLVTFLVGVGMAAARAWRAHPGAVAALVLFTTHAALDWDWQMPALTLVALVLAGLLIAASEEAPA